MSAPPRPPARKPSAMPAFLLAGALIGLIGGITLGRNARRTDIGMEGGPAVLLWLPLFWFVAVLVHELGHVVAGRLAGMRFVLLAVGPLKLVNVRGSLRVRLNTTPGMWGGLALMVPANTDRFRARLALLVAGGPLASLLLAAVLAVAAANLEGAPRTGAAVGSLLSGAIAVATLIPVTIGGYASDGGQLLGLLRRDGAAEIRGAIATIAGASMSGTRPRDYDSTLIERALALSVDGMPRVGTLILAALRSVDRGEDASAFFGPLEPLYSGTPDGMRQGVAVWLAWHHAMERHDAATAASWLARGKGGLVDPDQRALAEAAVAFAAGDRAAAGAAVRRGLALKPGMDPGASLLVRDLLLSIEGRLAA